ncbi:hypothetical protein SCUCBS95973_005422 [Sporothrix curviconia]|uniref:Uncharacterized protein n=1 Tax=Sporothrix curviconia TaxID=1260050 RepID=A0ABP0BWQ0_9PEZI
MAATVTASFHPMDITSFGAPLSKGHLLDAHTHSRRRPTAVYPAHVKALLGLIAQHDVGHLIGIYSIHRHERLPSDTVRLETHDLGIEGGSWTRAAAIDGIDLKGIHANLFKLTQNALVPLELAAGPSFVEVGTGPAANVSAAFLLAAAEYLAKNRLENVLGLEVKKLNEKDAQGCKFMDELEIQWGDKPGSECFAVLLAHEARAKGDRIIGPLTPTGWYATGGGAPADPDPVQPGTHYEKVVVGPKKETHKVIVNRSSSSVTVTPALVLGELVKMGLIALGA